MFSGLDGNCYTGAFFFRSMLWFASSVFANWFATQHFQRFHQYFQLFLLPHVSRFITFTFLKFLLLSSFLDLFVCKQLFRLYCILFLSIFRIFKETFYLVRYFRGRSVCGMTWLLIFCISWMWTFNMFSRNKLLRIWMELLFCLYQIK